MNWNTVPVTVDATVLKKLAEASRIVDNVSVVPCYPRLKITAIDADLRHAVLVVGFELEDGTLFHEVRGENVPIGGNVSLTFKFPIPLQFPIAAAMANHIVAITPAVEPSSWTTVFRRLYQAILERV